MKKQGKDGRFVRTRRAWTPKIWDDGCYDNRGRFRVYRPDCPRAYKGGYVLRAHAVWWLETGQVHPKGTNLHHINKIVDDDRFENLQLIDHGDHTRLHNSKPPLILVCDHCGKDFETSQGRINSRKKEGHRIRFCSLKCYWAHPKPKEMTIKTCAECGNTFELVSWRAKHVFCCSSSCGTKLGWRTRRFAS